MSEQGNPKYDFIVNSSKEYMSLIDRNYVYEAVNDAYCRSQGKTRSEILGKSVLEVWGEDVFQSSIKQRLDLCFLGEEIRYEDRFSFGNDEERYFDVSYYPYFENGKEVTHVAVISRDVTGDILSEKELQRTIYRVLSLTRILDAVSSSLDQDTILSVVCKELSLTLNINRVFFAILLDDKAFLQIITEYCSESRSSAMGVVFPVKDSPMAEFVLNRRTSYFANMGEMGEQEKLIAVKIGWERISSVMAVPVLVNGDVYGVISLCTSEKHIYSPEEISMVESLATIAGQSLENMHLYKTLQGVNENLTKSIELLKQRNLVSTLLSQMNDDLQICDSFQDAYAIASFFTQELFPGYQGQLLMLNEERTLLESVSSWGDPIPKLTSTSTDIHLINNWEGRHLYLEHSNRSGVNHDPQYPNVWVPLKTQRDVIGILRLYNPPDPIPDEWEQRMLSFTERLSLSLANLTLRQKLKIQSIQDPLTGLYNRRYLDDALDREVKLAIRHQRKIGLVMMDIDHFKHFNDTYGHDAGDEALRSLSKFLKSHVRSSDIVCRYGGEEFILVLPESSIEGSFNRAEELRRGISELRVEYQQEILSISVSAGVATFPQNGERADLVIQAADAALYRAKREGRNRIVIAEPRSV